MRKWRYMNPLNQVFLFLGGFLIGYFFKKTQINTYINLLLQIAAFLVFIFIPSEDDSVYITSGYNRIIFTLVCFIICFCFYKLHFRLPRILDRLLLKLGEASYSVYLIHPIIWAFVHFGTKKLLSLGIDIPSYLIISVCIAISLLTSYLVYLYYEKFFIAIGKKLLNKQS